MRKKSQTHKNSVTYTRNRIRYQVNRILTTSDIPVRKGIILTHLAFKLSLFRIPNELSDQSILNLKFRRSLTHLHCKCDSAYDIGCQFDTTVCNTSLLSRVVNANLCLMVGAFHGYGHNQQCQLHWHPTYLLGTGLSDGEGCEHVFSFSNKLA